MPLEEVWHLQKKEQETKICLGFQLLYFVKDDDRDEQKALLRCSLKEYDFSHLPPPSHDTLAS